IPGAVHLDVGESRVPVPGRGYRLPNVDEGARLFEKLGLAADTRVVIYDDAGGLNAAWLFYVLETLGHSRLAILDGAIAAGRHAGQNRRDVLSDAPSRRSQLLRPAAPRLSARGGLRPLVGRVGESGRSPPSRGRAAKSLSSARAASMHRSRRSRCPRSSGAGA